MVLTDNSMVFIAFFYGFIFSMVFIDFSMVSSFFHCLYRVLDGFDRNSMDFIDFPWFHHFCHDFPQFFRSIHRFFHGFHCCSMVFTDLSMVFIGFPWSVSFFLWHRIDCSMVFMNLFVVKSHVF